MQTMNKMTADESVFDWMKRHGIGYSAEFVPFSKSRNAKPGATIRDMQINWRLTFTKGGRAFSCDYSQGIGHLPMSVKQPWKGADSTLSRLSIDHDKVIRSALENGKVNRYGPTMDYCYTTDQTLPAPDASDVLESLVLDASVEDAGSFEDWASEYGYETDSRAAEKIYKACRELCDDMRVTFGREALAELRAMEWDT